MNRIFIAGPSTDLERCERWIRSMPGVGWEVTYDWTVPVRVGWGQEEHAGAQMSLPAFYAAADLEGVRTADCLWVLWGLSQGALVELGYGIGCGCPYIVISGCTAEEHIYTTFVAESGYGAVFRTDEEAFHSVWAA